MNYTVLTCAVSTVQEMEETRMHTAFHCIIHVHLSFIVKLRKTKSHLSHIQFLRMKDNTKEKFHHQSLEWYRIQGTSRKTGNGSAIFDD